MKDQFVPIHCIICNQPLTVGEFSERPVELICDSCIEKGEIEKYDDLKCRSRKNTPSGDSY